MKTGTILPSTTTMYLKIEKRSQFLLMFSLIVNKMENRLEKEGFLATSRIWKKWWKKIEIWYIDTPRWNLLKERKEKKLIVKYWFIHSNQSSSLSKYINKKKVNMIGNYLMMTLLLSLFVLIDMRWPSGLVLYLYQYCNNSTNE